MRLIISVFILGFLCNNVFAEQQAYKQIVKLMGVRFELTAVSGSEAVAHQAINSAILEIELLESVISSWDPGSQTSEINRQAGIKPVKVDPVLFNLIGRSKKISELSEGVFDISFASVNSIYTFDGGEHILPTGDEIAASVGKIDFRNIILNEPDQTVFLAEKGMRIGFGAIGKGLAANVAKKKMLALGINSGMVNAGGDLVTWGVNENNQDWNIGIANPKFKSEVLGWLVISDLAVVTSGNYEKYFTSHGVKYAHIINPKTGYPASGTKSVTIVCPDPELADALATTVFILGHEEGIELVNKLKNVECLLVKDNDELLTSNGLLLSAYDPKDVVEQND